MKRWTRNLLIAVVLVVIAGLSGLRVAHPNGGLSNALGPAHSGLAIYLKGDSVKVGQKVLYISQDAKHSPALGNISGVNPKYYDVENGKFLEGVDKPMIRGKLLVIVPFIGWLL
jgi:hypothetical protein